MKRIGNEELDLNRAAVGAISGVFGMYMLFKCGVDLLQIPANAVYTDPSILQEQLRHNLMDAKDEFAVALGFTVFGQFQLAFSAHDAPATNT